MGAAGIVVKRPGVRQGADGAEDWAAVLYSSHKGVWEAPQKTMLIVLLWNELWYSGDQWIHTHRERQGGGGVF